MSSLGFDGFPGAPRRTLLSGALRARARALPRLGRALSCSLALWLSIFLGAALGVASDPTGALKERYTLAEKIGIGIDGYLIGKRLSAEQFSRARVIEGGVSDARLMKLDDNGLHIVIEKASERVLILYRRYEKSDSGMLKRVVSSLIYRFDQPSSLAHDKTIYWFYSESGAKMTREMISDLKEGRASPEKLKPFVTIKFVSSESISSPDPKARIDLSYIVYSEPILKFFAP